MTGVDRQFTQMTQHRVGYWMSKLWLPVYFLTAGQGYKAVRQGEVVGCAFLHVRRLSGYVFNVLVDRPYRRQGIAGGLMDHVEGVARARGLPWLALLVDEGNMPAQTLYEQRHFRLYHPQYFTHALPNRRDKVSSSVTLLPGGLFGGSIYRQFAREECRHGDAWAAEVVIQEYNWSPPSGGSYWRCVWEQKFVGALWISGSPRTPIMALQLDPACWGHHLTQDLCRQLLTLTPPQWPHLELHVGSRDHFNRLAPLLLPHGFTITTRPRLLMLKKLA